MKWNYRQLTLMTFSIAVLKTENRRLGAANHFFQHLAEIGSLTDCGIISPINFPNGKSGKSHILYDRLNTE